MIGKPLEGTGPGHASRQPRRRRAFRKVESLREPSCGDHLGGAEGQTPRLRPFQEELLESPARPGSRDHHQVLGKVQLPRPTTGAVPGQEPLRRPMEGRTIPTQEEGMKEGWRHGQGMGTRGMKGG